jgi:S1-C subfamily serine protease
MRPAILNLIGLAIGAALAGAGLLWVGPRYAGLLVFPRVVERTGSTVTELSPLRPAALPVVRTAPTSLVKVPDLPLRVISGVPRMVSPGRRDAGQDLDPQVVPVPLPNVIGPNVVGPSPPPGAVVAGTGFFIAHDGSLLTASHVVRDCQHIRIVSRTVRMTDADRLAEDESVDVALLRAPGVRPSAILALASSPPAGGRLFVLGYPATANLRIPNETWATLENTRPPPGLGRIADTRQMVWVQSYAVTHGYSGGPMFDPRSGAVAGLVKAGIEPKYASQARSGISTAGLSFGPGAAQLAAFVRREAPDLELASQGAADGDALDAARRATVHVLCWR